MTTNGIDHFRTPLSAKMIILVQFLVILFFGFWMYQEYTYNIFFQQYVNGFISDNMTFLIAACGGIGFLGTGLGMYIRSHGRGHSVELISESGNNGSLVHEPSMKGGKLDTHTEQTLIDMIRKTVPPSNSAPAGSASAAAAASGPLPTLQRVDDKKTP